jgi:hypothetical protein
MSSPKILVTGDHGCDYDIYLHTNEDNPPPGTPPAVINASAGGAGIVHRLLKCIAHKADGLGAQGFDFDVGLGVEKNANVSPTAALWQKFKFGALAKSKEDQDKLEVWRTRRSLSLGRVAQPNVLPTIPLEEAAPANFNPDVIVIEDNAAGVRFCVPEWLQKLNGKSSAKLPRWIVLKTSAPLCTGQLWWELLANSKLADRLVVVVPIKDLRRAEVRVSQAISWEHPALESLRRARHVVVTLHGEGALWMGRPAKDRLEFKLFFDPRHMEGEWSRAACGNEGDAYGYHSCFAASVTAHLAAENDNSPDEQLKTGILNGLRAMRFLRAVGHGKVGAARPGFPAGGIALMILSDDAKKPADVEALLVEDVSIPAADWSRLGSFGEAELKAKPGVRVAFAARTAAEKKEAATCESILESSDIRATNDQPLYGLARRVALLGLDALANVPFASFGDLFTVDRAEIEALRNLQRLVQAYDQAGHEAKPLSLAVFGPPGAGKSFGIKQIAKTVIDAKKQAFLEFNLSQFSNPGDLIGAFHQVRDKVLEGKLPIVFWDEFDAEKNKWLQFLLAPMQDGKFQEGQITHPIGRCIFVFAGATSYTFENFGLPERSTSPGKASLAEHKEALNDFRLKKGPDFKSRLHGFLNVLGPNPRQRFEAARPPNEQWRDDATDICFPVRRAVLLRSWLGMMNPQKKSSRERLEMDSGLLTALLEVGHYRHGARSMEKIVTSLKTGGKKEFRRSALPADAVLEMNVRGLEQFKSCLVQARDFQDKSGLIAPAIHARWLEKADRENIFLKKFDELGEEAKQDNYFAAHRIPALLGLVGLELVEANDKRQRVENAAGILRAHLERLAEEEHIGWMEFRLANGWRPVERTEDKQLRRQHRVQRLHDCLIPYPRLPEEEKEKDRGSILWFPEMAKLAGFKIVARQPPEQMRK